MMVKLLRPLIFFKKDIQDLKFILGLNNFSSQALLYRDFNNGQSKIEFFEILDFSPEVLGNFNKLNRYFKKINLNFEKKFKGLPQSVFIATDRSIIKSKNFKFSFLREDPKKNLQQLELRDFFEKAAWRIIHNLAQEGKNLFPFKIIRNDVQKLTLDDQVLFESTALKGRQLNIEVLTSFIDFQAFENLQKLFNRFKLKIEGFGEIGHMLGYKVFDYQKKNFILVNINERNTEVWWWQEGVLKGGGSFEAGLAMLKQLSKNFNSQSSLPKSKAKKNKTLKLKKSESESLNILINGIYLALKKISENKTKFPCLIFIHSGNNVFSNKEQRSFSRLFKKNKMFSKLFAAQKPLRVRFLNSEDLFNILTNGGEILEGEEADLTFQRNFNQINIQTLLATKKFFEQKNHQPLQILFKKVFTILDYGQR